MQGRHALVMCLGLAVLQVHADEKSHAAAPRSSEFVYIGTQGLLGPPPGAAPAAAGQAAAPRPAPAVPAIEKDPSMRGIYAAKLDTRTGHLTSLGLTAQLQRSTWMVVNPTQPVLYAVADSGGGMRAHSSLYSLGIDRKTGLLHVLNKVDAGGSDATHLDLDARSRTLFSANHGSGDVSAVPLQADGSLADVASNQKDFGTGPNRRQSMPQAHSVAIDPTGKYVLVSDFGADRIFIYHFDAKSRTLSPSQPAFDFLPGGSGPRHILFHPNGRFLFLDTEISAELRSYAWDPKKGLLHLVQKLSPLPANYTGEKSAAEIAVSHDGRFLYLSLRGDSDSIFVYRINKQSGMLTEIQHIPAQGKTPWSFGIDPSGRWLLVTNAGSDAVVVMKIDAATGKLSATGESLAIPQPVAVAFYPK